MDISQKRKLDIPKKKKIMKRYRLIVNQGNANEHHKEILLSAPCWKCLKGRIISSGKAVEEGKLP